MTRNVRTVLCSGSPCCCRPGRYVRWIDLPGVPGLEPAVHCRDRDAGTEGRETHDLPADAVVLIRVPVIG